MTSDPGEAIDRLVEAALLTERQAEAYVRRDIEAEPREAAAQAMGISPNTLDIHLSDARDKVDAAKATVDVIRDLRSPTIPDECSECGAAIGGFWTETEDGEPLCLDCAGIDPDDALSV